MTYAGCTHHSESENDYQEGIGYICEKCFRAEREGTSAALKQERELADRLGGRLQAIEREHYNCPDAFCTGENGLKPHRPDCALNAALKAWQEAREARNAD